MIGIHDRGLLLEMMPIKIRFCGFTVISLSQPDFIAILLENILFVSRIKLTNG